MRWAKHYDLETGDYIGFIRATAVDERLRRAFRYECPEAGCTCTLHWRKETRLHGNAETLSQTFVKNPSSDHRAGCGFDIPRVLREGHGYIMHKDGAFHARINFPLGHKRKDIRPMAGDLTAAQVEAAQGHADIAPFSSLADLARMVNKLFGGIDTKSADELVVLYQGNATRWSKLFKGSDQYEKLFLRALKAHDRDEIAQPIVTVVKPLREIEPNAKGKRRFECETQQVRADGRRQNIRPIIVCDTYNRDLAPKIEQILAAGSPAMIAARPYHPGFGRGGCARYGLQKISLYLHTVDQICAAKPDDWKPNLIGPSRQPDLFVGQTHLKM